MDVFSPGKSVNYSCDPGYSLVGKSSLHCTDNASWSTPHPRCEGELLWWAVRGQRPSRGLNKKRSVQRGSWQQLQQHFLGMGEQTGMDLKAPNPGTPCMSAPGVSKLPPTESGDCKSSGPHESKLASSTCCMLCSLWWHCACNPCFTTPHSCSFPVSSVLQCPSPPSIEGGSHNSQEVEAFIPGMVVNYSCDPGFSLLGEASIYCTESGNWSLPPPQCAGTWGGQLRAGVRVGNLCHQPVGLTLSLTPPKTLNRQVLPFCCQFCLQTFICAYSMQILTQPDGADGHVQVSLHSLPPQVAAAHLQDSALLS